MCLVATEENTGGNERIKATGGTETEPTKPLTSKECTQPSEGIAIEKEGIPILIGEGIPIEDPGLFNLALPEFTDFEEMFFFVVEEIVYFVIYYLIYSLFKVIFNLLWK